jgi:uncharacterized membrane protein
MHMRRDSRTLRAVPESPSTRDRRGLPTTRLEAFSDGVFAIAITLLVLEIAVPLATESDLFGALVDEWPSYAGYVISFLTIGWVWIGHSAITSHLERANALFLRLNLLLLMAVAFLPFPTRLMADFFGQPEPERVAVVFYGIVLLVIAVLMAVLWRYALASRELLRSDRADDELATLTAKSSRAIVLFFLATAVGVVFPMAGALLFLVVSAYLVIPFGTISVLRGFRRRP